jgi:hypothetical protein
MSSTLAVVFPKNNYAHCINLLPMFIMLHFETLCLTNAMLSFPFYKPLTNGNIVNIFAIRTAMAAMLLIAGSAFAGTIDSASKHDMGPDRLVGTFDKAGNTKGSSTRNDVNRNAQFDPALTEHVRNGTEAGNPQRGNFGKITPASIVIVDVPEPATPLTVALGLGLVALMARRRRNAA